jgi:uncharacterized membrane protein (GlpM family)
MQRLKMSGVLPPLPHLFMASHIISGTLSFTNSVTFATVFCLYLSVLYHCIYEISMYYVPVSHFQKTISLSISVCGCMCTYKCL